MCVLGASDDGFTLKFHQTPFLAKSNVASTTKKLHKINPSNNLSILNGDKHSPIEHSNECQLEIHFLG